MFTSIDCLRSRDSNLTSTTGNKAERQRAGRITHFCANWYSIHRQNREPTSTRTLGHCIWAVQHCLGWPIRFSILDRHRQAITKTTGSLRNPRILRIQPSHFTPRIRPLRPSSGPRNGAAISRASAEARHRISSACQARWAKLSGSWAWWAWWAPRPRRREMDIQSKTLEGSGGGRGWKQLEVEAAGGGEGVVTKGIWGEEGSRLGSGCQGMS